MRVVCKSLIFQLRGQIAFSNSTSHFFNLSSLSCISARSILVVSLASMSYSLLTETTTIYNSYRLEGVCVLFLSFLHNLKAISILYTSRYFHVWDGHLFKASFWKKLKTFVYASIAHSPILYYSRSNGWLAYNGEF